MADLASILLSTTPQAGIESGLKTGEQLAGSFEQAKANAARLEAQKTQEQLAQGQAQRAEALAPSQLEAAKSQASIEQFKAAHPGLSIPATANPIAVLDYIGQKYGYNSPQYKEHEQNQNDKEALDSAHTNYYNTLATNLAADHQPALIKTQNAVELSNLNYPSSVASNLNGHERAYIVENNIPYTQWEKEGANLSKVASQDTSIAPIDTTGHAALPTPQQIPSAAQSNQSMNSNHQALSQQAQDEGNILKSSLAKSSLATSQQQMLGRANTALKLIHEIEPNLDAFGEYLGASGQTKQLGDKAGSYLGRSSSPDFIKYQNVVALLPMLKNELSQAFGASKTQEEQDAIDKVTSPAFWQNSQNYKAKLKQVRTMLENQRDLIGQPLAVQQNMKIGDQAAPITIPTLQNNAQKTAWLNSLSQTQKIQLKKQLSN